MHHHLGISDLPEFDMDSEMLRIEFDYETGKIKLEYQETHSPLHKRWRKICSPDEVFPALVRFLQLKNWCGPWQD